MEATRVHTTCTTEVCVQLYAPVSEVCVRNSNCRGHRGSATANGTPRPTFWPTINQSQHRISAGPAAAHTARPWSLVIGQCMETMGTDAADTLRDRALPSTVSHWSARRRSARRTSLPACPLCIISIRSIHAALPQTHRRPHTTLSNTTAPSHTANCTVRVCVWI